MTLTLEPPVDLHGQDTPDAAFAALHVTDSHVTSVPTQPLTVGEYDERMRQQVREKLGQGPGLTVADIRDLLGTTRKFAVPICEYLDRIGVTKRNGDLRVAAR